MARSTTAAETNDHVDPKWVLRLYVSGMSPGSARAITAIKSICEEHIADDYELRVFDVYRDPGSADVDRVRATPTLVRAEPLPETHIFGYLDDHDRVADSLGLPPRRRLRPR